MESTRLENAAQAVIDRAKAAGASYADVRFVEETTRGLAVRKSVVSRCVQDSSFGVGVRVLVGGAWGYASAPVPMSDDGSVDVSALRQLSDLATAEASAGARHRPHPAVLAPLAVQRGTYVSPRVEDPFSMSLEEQFDVLFEVDRELVRSPDLATTSSEMSFRREQQWQFTSDGSATQQDLLRSGAGFSLTLARDGAVQTRSYPASFGGQYLQGGFEIVRSFDLRGAVERIRDEAAALLVAEPCPGGRFDLVTRGSQLALQIHESVGHPGEFDRVLGFEADMAGTSFVTPEKRNQFVYGSELVDLVADSSLDGGIGTFGWDDDGVPAQSFPVVERGIHRNWFTNREFATRVGDAASNGTNRAEGWRYPPQIRIPNLSLMWGSSTERDLIAGVDDGFLLDGVKTWSIDQMRLNFQFTCEIGWRIRNGELCEVVKNPTYQGVTPEFWRSCDGIAGREEWAPWGVPNCGKGQPMQVAEMSHGCAPARFRGVTFVGA
ncbi:MAG: TldD/PmbA family protein [Planctomycetes bacterium]|nr:TldD/PmbA family protein [Planctomycetota bacterium]